jgi:Straboviridae DNA polymerase processivity component
MTQKLKLSAETVAVLQNFSGINKNILVKPGSTLTTMSDTKSIIGVAEVAEVFPIEFAIAELPKFLSSLSLFSEPELEFSDKRVTIREGDQKLNYTFDDKRVVLSIEADTIKKLGAVIDKGEIEFDWTDAVFQGVSKARAILKLPEFVVEGDGKNISLKAQDTVNSTGNTYEAQVGDSDAEFRAVFRAENIRFLPRDYHVKYATKGLARFDGGSVTYYVTTEAKK